MKIYGYCRTGSVHLYTPGYPVTPIRSEWQSASNTICAEYVEITLDESGSSFFEAFDVRY